MTYILALDQGTTSTRCIVFDHAGAIVATDQREHAQILPRPGWVEHDPAEIWARVQDVIAGALQAASITRAKRWLAHYRHHQRFAHNVDESSDRRLGRYNVGGV